MYCQHWQQETLATLQCDFSSNGRGPSSTNAFEQPNCFRLLIALRSKKFGQFRIRTSLFSKFHSITTDDLTLIVGKGCQKLASHKWKLIRTTFMKVTYQLSISNLEISHSIYVRILDVRSKIFNSRSRYKSHTYFVSFINQQLHLRQKRCALIVSQLKMRVTNIPGIFMRMNALNS